MFTIKFFGSFGGEHLQLKPRCMSNINCPFEIDSKGVQVELDVYVSNIHKRILIPVDYCYIQI